MKVWKKNLVAAAILVTVCAGIYVNWLYTEDSTAVSLEDSLDAEKVMSDDSLALEGDMAAIAAGCDGLIIEVHNDPPHAKCDGQQSLTPKQFDELMKKVEALVPMMGKKLIR